MNESIFEKYSDYYDLIYGDKDYESEAEYVHNIIKKYGPNFKNILEFGSGTGKHAQILTKFGYKIHGVELSQKMVSGTKIVPGFTCQQGNIENIKLNKSFDIVLSLFHVLSYQITNKQLKDVFSNAAAHLKKNGLFIFDFWFSPAIYTNKPSVRIKKVKNKNIEITRIAKPIILPKENRVDVNYEISVTNLTTKKIEIFNETHSVRHFNLLEIDLVSSVYGFERLDANEFKTGKEINENTWGPCVILKKKN